MCMLSGFVFLCKHKGMGRRRASKSDVFLYYDNNTSGVRLGVINAERVMKAKKSHVDIQEMSLFS